MALNSIRYTVTEAVRYRGRSGHYSWLLHRLSGLAILGFLLIHVWDGSMATYSPRNYAWTLALFKNPIFGLGEVAVFGAVLFHAFNGLRITLLDWRPQWWKYQDSSAKIVWGLFLLLFIPLGAMLLWQTIQHCSHPVVYPNGQELSCFAIPPRGAYFP